MGAGLGLLGPPPTAALLGIVDTRRSGLASGVLKAARQTGSGLGSCRWARCWPQPWCAGARTSFALAAALVAALAVVWLAPARGHRQRLVC